MSTPDVLDDTKAPTTPRRRLRWLVIIAVLAIVAAAAVVAVRVWPSDSDNLASPLQPWGEERRPPTGLKFVNFRGVEILVPDTMLDRTAKDACDPIEEDAILLEDNDVMPACFVHQSPGITLVRISPVRGESLGQWESLLTREVTIDGLAARRGVGVPAYGQGGPEYAILHVPSRQVFITVESPDPAARERILDSARIVAMDAAGCPSAIPAFQAAPSTRDGSDSRLVPGTPIRAVLCRYTDLYLHKAVPPRPREFIETLNTLPSGLSRPNPKYPASVASRCPEHEQRGFVLRYVYERGPGVDVFVSISACDTVWASNGAHTTKLSNALTRGLVDRGGFDTVFFDSEVFS